MTSSDELLVKFLVHNKSSIHPGKGKADAKLVREVCEHLGLDEDDFLQRYVTKDKQRWGLTE